MTHDMAHKQCHMAVFATWYSKETRQSANWEKGLRKKIPLQYKSDNSNIIINFTKNNFLFRRSFVLETPRSKKEINKLKCVSPITVAERSKA
jgi:hypothetical protein